MALQGVRTSRSRIKLRKRTAAAELVSQRTRPADCRKRQRGIKMWKEFAAARVLPDERHAQRFGVDRNQDQSRFFGKMIRGRFGELCSGGEMDEAVALVG